MPEQALGAAIFGGIVVVSVLVVLLLEFRDERRRRRGADALARIMHQRLAERLDRYSPRDVPMLHRADGPTPIPRHRRRVWE